MSRWHHQVLRWLLLPALLHLLLTPLGGVARAAASARWSPAAERALLNLLEKPDPAWKLHISTRDGRTLAGRLTGWRSQPDSLYQSRLEAWIGRDAARRALPPLGGELVLANRFVSGKAVRGRFGGFQGPLLLLEREGRLRPYALEGLELESASGRWRIQREALDRQGDWPPSRGLLDLSGAAGSESLPLDEVLELCISSDWLGLGVMAVPLALMALLFFGFRSMRIHGPKSE